MITTSGDTSIRITHGDSYQKTIIFENIPFDSIEAVYMTCKQLNLQKQATLNNEDYYQISFTPEETSALPNEKLETTYDLTVYLTKDKVKTALYNQPFIIVPKINVVNTGDGTEGVSL